MFTQYRERLHFKKAANTSFSNPKKVDWRQKKIGTVGILVSAVSLEIKSVQQFLKKLEKRTNHLQILAFAETNAAPASKDYPIFTTKEVDWLWRPKGEKTAAFSKNSFDILINLCQRNCYPLEYLAVTCNAGLKIGTLTTYPSNYDLMLETDSLDNYMNQVMFFLAKFRSQYEQV